MEAKLSTFVILSIQVSVDVAWSSNGVDGRYYEYKKIAAYSDVIFIMAYDEQSQILSGPCTARYVNKEIRYLSQYVLMSAIPVSKIWKCTIKEFIAYTIQNGLRYLLPLYT